MSKCVLKEWVHDLTLQMQGTLLCAMRGPDGLPKEGAHKEIVRAFRAVLTNNAKSLGPDNTFAGDGSGTTSQEAVEAFFVSTDEQPHHWRMHLIHAAEIVGYFHPDERVANFWRHFYIKACMDMHVDPETKEKLSTRLCGDGA